MPRLPCLVQLNVSSTCFTAFTGCTGEAMDVDEPPAAAAAAAATTEPGTARVRHD